MKVLTYIPPESKVKKKKKFPYKITFSILLVLSLLTYVYFNAPESILNSSEVDSSKQAARILQTVGADECGNLSVANTVFTLNSTVSSAGDCFIIQANNITLDCAGFTINYSQSTAGEGITINDFNDTTIRNCAITQGGTSSSSEGIFALTNFNTTIINNTFSIRGNQGHAIRLFDSDNANISFNDATTLGNSSGDGIQLSQFSEFNTITRNNFTALGDSHGMQIFGSENNIITFNTVVTEGNLHGIAIESDADFNDVSNNIITTTDNGNAINIDGSRSNNISLNNLTASGSGTDAFIIDNSLFNIVSLNNITTNGNSGIGISILSSANFNTIFLNTITTTDNFATGIDLAGGSVGNNISSNIVTTSQIQASGIRVSSSSTNENIIESNQITTAGSQAFGLAVFGASNVYSDNFINSTGAASISIGFNGQNNSFTNNTLVDNGELQLLLSVAFINSTFLIDQPILNYSINNNTFNIQDSQFGIIGFISFVNATGSNLSNDIRIANNSATVESDTAPGLNRSANITLFGLPTSFTSPVVLRDGFECNVTTSPTCSNFTSLNAGTVRFNVSSWTEYSIGEGIPPTSACGNLSTPNSVETLVSDVNSSGTCFTIQANNITLDCAGFEINYSRSSVGIGVTNTGFNDIQVRNCVITQGSTIPNSRGIEFSNSLGANISNNVVTTSGNASYAINMFFASNNTVLENNTVTVSTTFDSQGLRFVGAGRDIRVEDNIVIDARDTGITGSFSDVIISNNVVSSRNGIIIFDSPNNYTITDNNITTVGTTSNQQGIEFQGVTNSLISNNTISTTGTIFNDGISLVSSSDNNIVTSNNITTSGSGDGNRGVDIASSSNNTFIGNIISTGGTFSDHGFLLTSSSSNNNISSNTITTQSTSSNMGLFVASSSSNNFIFNNTITTNGTFNNNGMFFEATSTGNSIISNTIVANGTGTDNRGIVVNSGPQLIDSNTITAQGSQSNHGIEITGGNEVNVTFNIITTNGSLSSNRGITFTGSENNSISFNNVTTDGTDNNYGIFFDSSNDNTAFNNSFSTNGRTGGANFGVVIQSNTNGTNIISNSIITNTTSTHGIQISASSRTVINFNDLTTTGTISDGIRLSPNTSTTNLTGNTFSVTRFDINIDPNNDTSFIDQTITNYSITDSSVLFRDETFGQISFIPALTQVGTNLSNDIRIANNSVTVESLTAPGFNVSANVTLFGIGERNFTNIAILRDGVVCDSTTSPQCFNFTALNATDVRFNVTSWSNYSIGSGPGITIVRVQNVTTNSSGGFQQFTMTHTTSGINRLLIVSAALDDGSVGKNITSVRYNGDFLTQIFEDVHVGDIHRTQVWQLVNPDLGEHTILINISAGQTNTVAIGAVSFINVNQSDSVNNLTGNMGLSTETNVTVTSVVGDLVFDFMMSEASGAPIVNGGPEQIEIYNIEIGGTNTFSGASIKNGTAGEVDMSWNLSESKEWHDVGMNILAFESDSIAPDINLTDPTPSNGSTLTQSNIPVNVTAVDENVLDTITIFLFNSSNDLVNTTSSQTSPLFINFTGLPDDIYFINATANDTFNNINSTETRQITLDTAPPRVIIVSPNLSTAVDVNSTVAIILNITSFRPIDTVSANVTHVNGSIIPVTNFGSGLQSDNFTTDTIGINWSFRIDALATGQNCDANIAGSQLFLTINGTGTAGSTSCGLSSIRKVGLDYDMNVSFNITEFGNDTFFIFRVNDQPSLLSAGIRVFAFIFETGGTKAYLFGFANSTGDITTTGFTPTTDTFGKLRIRRTNSTGTPVFEAFFFNNTANDWEVGLPPTELEGMSPTQFIQIYPESVGPDLGNMNVTVDSFEHSGTDLLFGLFNQTTEEGIYNVSVFVNDSAGFINDTETTQFNVSQDNFPPSQPLITTPVSEQIVGGFTNITWLAVSDPDGDSLQFNITLLNPDNSFNQTLVEDFGNASTILFEWNTTNSTDGNYNVRVTVFENETADGLSNFGTVNNVTVDNTFPTINFVAPTETDGSTLMRNNIQINVTSTDTHFQDITIFLFNSTNDLINQTTTTSSPNFVNITMLDDGLYFFNATATDQAGNTNFTATRNVTLDSTPPSFSDITENPSDPATYVLGQVYEFNSTWNGGSPIDTVIMEFDGVNTTVPGSGGGVFSFTISDLAVGTFTYTWYANDTANNQNNTGPLTYTVVKASSTVSLTLDGVSADKTVFNGTSTNITMNGTIVFPDVLEEVIIFQDSIQIANDTKSVQTSGIFNDTGVFNITAFYAGNENFTSSFQTFFINVITPIFTTCDTASQDIQITENGGNPFVRLCSGISFR